jgi:hypothetical protein
MLSNFINVRDQSIVNATVAHKVHEIDIIDRRTHGLSRCDQLAKLSPLAT